MCNSTKLDKIKKLLALTEENGATESEAMSAIAIAQKLALQEGINIDSVEVDLEPESVNREVVETELDIDSSRPSTVVSQLAKVVADNFRCSCIRDMSRSTRSASLVFIGLINDVAMAKEVFQFALNAVDKCAAKYLRQRRKEEYHWDGQKAKLIKADYVCGFIDGVKDALYENANRFGLVTTKPIEVRQHLAGMNLRRGSTRKVSVWGDACANSQGRIDGSSQIKGRSASKTLSCAS